MRVLILIIGWGLAILAPAAEMRIASFSPGATQTIIDLGSGDQIVAATRWCPLPSAHPAQRSCDIFLPDLEALQKLRPTLVILPRMANPLWAEKCRSAGLKTLILNPESPASVAQDIIALGATLHQTATAEKLSRLMMKAGAAVPLKTIIIIWDGVMAGPDSYLSGILASGGFKSALPTGTWLKFDWEMIAQAQPDAVLWIDNAAADRPIIVAQRQRNEMMQIPVVNKLKCVKAGKVFETSAGSRWLPGSGLVDTLPELRKLNLN
jgi:ABC-type Fe3+-hydroxamate transport system substrate-binding protein